MGRYSPIQLRKNEMIYRFDFTLDGKAVNEQWHDDARMFVLAAENALMHPSHSKAYCNLYAGRLLEYAAACYSNAAGETLGHGKTERYLASEQECRERSAALYEQAKTLAQ